MKLDIDKVIEMRREEKSLSEIGDYFGVSKQYISQVITQFCTIDGKKIKYKNFIFPGITDYMRQNYIKTPYLASCISMKSSNLFNRLTGKVQFKKDEIDKLLDFTGMTYEEIFKTQEDKKDA